MNNIKLSNQAKAFIGVGLLGTSLIVGGALHDRPNKCETILVDSTELLELANDYVKTSGNIIQLGGALQPILSDLNRNNMEMKRNNCQGQVDDKYFDNWNEAYDNYRDSVLARYPFMTGWL